MREATLKLKRRIESVNITNNNVELRALILRSLLTLFAGLGMLYLLILSNTVWNIVERKSLEKEALSLANDVGDLEVSYLNISKSVDLSMSASMGFTETKATFATRKALGSLKVAQNEI